MGKPPLFPPLSDPPGFSHGRCHTHSWNGADTQKDQSNDKTVRLSFWSYLTYTSWTSLWTCQQVTSAFITTYPRTARPSSRKGSSTPKRPWLRFTRKPFLLSQGQATSTCSLLSLVTNSIFFLFACVKTHWFAWRPNQWPLMGEDIVLFRIEVFVVLKMTGSWHVSASPATAVDQSKTH